MTEGRQVHGTLWALMTMSLALALTVGVSACGSSSASPKSGGTATVLMGTAPDSLDPGLGATTQSYEATWIAYTGLVTYAHASGEAGTKLIPGLAESLPAVSADGKTYTFTLRHGLVYSNGTPVKASDFAHTIERAIKLGWGNKELLTENIAGGEEFDKGKASSISGIQTDDATGKITIKLVAPYGPFVNVLAFPAAGLVPSATPMKSLPNSPPPGVGAYEIASVVPNKSFSLVRNPHFLSSTIPGVPIAHVEVGVKIVSNNQSEAEQVLGNTADVFDYNDTIPPTLISQVESQASGRYTKEPTVSGEYFFLNTKSKPFDNQLVREAVNYAIDRRALQRLDSGMLDPGCYFLPVGMPGHPTSPCPYGEPSAAPNLTKAKELVQQSGLGRHARHGVGTIAQPAQGIRRLLRERAERDRAQSDREDRRRRAVLRHRRQPLDRRADRLAVLQPGLPQPDRLLPAARREIDPAHRKPQPQPGQRPAHPERTRLARTGPLLAA